MDYILNISPDALYDLVIKVREKENEERIWQRWLLASIWMDKDNFVSFKDYMDEFTGKNICHLSSEEIFRECEEIEKKIQGGEGNGA